MGARARWGEGWSLVGIAVLSISALLAGLWLLGPGGEQGVRALVRATARVSMTLFLLAYTASSARRLWPNPATAWLLRNRRQLGVSFALAHGVHLAAIATLGALWPHPFQETEGRPSVLIGGGIAYLFIALMTATSFDRSAAWLGGRRWRALHGAGSLYVWVIFTSAYARRAMLGPGYAAATVLLLAAQGLRLAAWRRARA